MDHAEKVFDVVFLAIDEILLSGDLRHSTAQNSLPRHSPILDWSDKRQQENSGGSGSARKGMLAICIGLTWTVFMIYPVAFVRHSPAS